jgi:hypothetical protein
MNFMTRTCRYCAVLIAAMTLSVCSIHVFGAAEQDNAQLETEWLFQANGAITKDTVLNEIKYTQELIARLSKMEKAPNLTEETKKLDALKAAANEDVKGEKVKANYLAIRALKRTIFFKNPIIDFDRILLIDNPYPKGKPGDATDEWGHEARHRNGFMAVDGGRLLSVGLHPGSEVTTILPELKGSFWRPDVSFDGKEILISYRPVGE